MDNRQKDYQFLGKNLNQSYTMHELSKLLRIPYATFYRMIKEIEDLLVIKNVGKSKTIQINSDNPIIKAHLIISSDEEKKDFCRISRLSRKLKVNWTLKKSLFYLGLR